MLLKNNTKLIIVLNGVPEVLDLEFHGSKKDLPVNFVLVVKM